MASVSAAVHHGAAVEDAIVTLEQALKILKGATITMGLDTTHDCWHGPYSQFMRWRQWLNLFVMTDRGDAGDEAARKISHMGATAEAIERAWNEGHYEDQSVPINVLMGHSDCDGDIPAKVCGPLADALEVLLEKHMPQRGIYDQQRPATERFIRGLRRAAAAEEAVEFH